MTDATLKLLVSSNGVPRALLIEGVEVPGVTSMQIDCAPGAKVKATVEIYVREVHTIRDGAEQQRSEDADRSDRDADGQADAIVPG